jgi:hypothetical protein
VQVKKLHPLVLKGSVGQDSSSFHGFITFPVLPFLANALQSMSGALRMRIVLEQARK